MRNLIKRLFKSEPQFNYILAEYQPNQKGTSPNDVPFLDHDYSNRETKDEMQIDRLYQNN